MSEVTHVRWFWQQPAPTEPVGAVTAAVAPTRVGRVPRAVTAAASVHTGRERIVVQTDQWQEEVWGYYDSLGEFGFAVDWHSSALSRVRLRAARVRPDQDEPEIVDDGVAADLVAELGGNVAGRAQLMKTFTQLLDIPGEAWLVGETVSGRNVWDVRSSNEIRPRAGEIQVVDVERSQGGEVIWRDLDGDFMLARIWRPHARYRHLADSPARRARATMRELELVNRKMQAQYLSRLASAGIVVFPEEITFPVREEFQDADDPFVAEWIETARQAIRDHGTAASIVPIPMRVPGEYVDKIRFIEFTQEFDRDIVAKRESAIRRLATHLDLPAEIILGMGDVNHWCAVDSTEIFTRDRGWVTHDALAVGDVVLTLNHDTGLSEWQPVLDVARFDVVDEPTLRITGRFQSSETTMNHRWPVVDDAGRRVWRTSATLAPTDRQVLGAYHADLPDAPKYTDEFVQLVAWVTTDGSFRRWQARYRGTTQVALHQSHVIHPNQVVEIRALLTRLFGPPSVGTSAPGRRDTVARWREHTYASGITTWVLNRVTAELLAAVMSVPDKIVTREFIYDLTGSQLELFIRTYAAGDGARSGRGSYLTSQREARRLDAFELAATLAGYVTSRDVRRSSGYRPGELTEVRAVPSDNVVVPDALVRVADRARPSAYTGTVWCPTTRNGTWFARHDGRSFYTGNSAWQLDESAIKIHIAPTCELICHGLTRGYLAPRLAALGEDTVEWVVWYDASELTLRPDRSANAKDAYDRYELSGRAYRREVGFDEDDRPTDDEFTDQVIRFLARQPASAATALDLIAPGTIEVPTTAPAASGTGDAPTEDEPPTGDQPGPPGTRDDAPPGATASVDTPSTRVTAVDVADHTLVLDVLANAWSIRHSAACEHPMRCPVTWATFLRPVDAAPGTSGTYEMRATSDGKISIGRRLHDAANGHATSQVR